MPRGIHRRTFLGRCVLFRAVRPTYGAHSVTLEAVAAPVMPARMVLPSHYADPVYELRDYHNAAAWSDPIADLLVGAMRSPVRCSPTVFLIGFDSMAERAVAWARVNTDPVWKQLCEDVAARTGGSLEVRISLWRRRVSPE